MGAPILERSELQPAAQLFAKACHASRLHSRLAARAFDRYGDAGPQISGCVRDWWPEPVKNRLRQLARATSEFSDAAWNARPSRIRAATMRHLARSVATRDGSGFYGPQPYRF